MSNKLLLFLCKTHDGGCTVKACLQKHVKLYWTQFKCLDDILPNITNRVTLFAVNILTNAYSSGPPHQKFICRNFWFCTFRVGWNRNAHIYILIKYLNLLVYFRSWEKCWSTLSEMWTCEMWRWIRFALLEVMLLSNEVVWILKREVN